ncbi:Rieske (2Fe-2S) protein [Methylobacterium nigriterrae]|uniref:Rieske (2Fe-2S) protein n=1 Tax=Methylobacterium nigriterrae TaxID=3127512 RepID=UPI003013724C
MPDRAAPAGSPRWLPAGRLEALDARPILPVLVEGRPLILVRDGGRIFAAERACPHEGADLARGRCSEGRLLCPHHLAWFRLEDGAVSPGWSFRPLRTYPVRTLGGVIEVDLGRAGSAP